LLIAPPHLFNLWDLYQSLEGGFGILRSRAAFEPFILLPAG